MKHGNQTTRPVSSEKIPDCADLKKRLRQVGLSQRKAAPLVGVVFPYLNTILNHKRQHPGYAVRLRLDALLKEREAGL